MDDVRTRPWARRGGAAVRAKRYSTDRLVPYPLRPAQSRPDPMPNPCHTSCDLADKTGELDQGRLADAQTVVGDDRAHQISRENNNKSPWDYQGGQDMASAGRLWLRAAGAQPTRFNRGGPGQHTPGKTRLTASQPKEQSPPIVGLQLTTGRPLQAPKGRNRSHDKRGISRS